MLDPQGPVDRVLELLHTGQHKLALNLCDKALKKAKDNEKLLTQRIAILLNWPDPARREQGLKDFDSLLERKPQLQNIDDVVFLDSAVTEAPQGCVPELQSRIAQLWLKIANSRPKDENFHKAWYREKIRRGDRKAAQQASMTWMKNFPHEREPYFLYIITTHLLAEKEKPGSSEAQIFRSLVYKTLSKAYATTQDANVTPKPSRSIQTLEDLLLLLRIYRAQERYKEAFAVVEAVQGGVVLESVRSAWELARQYIGLAELTEQWAKQHSFCYDILKGALDVAINPLQHSKFPWGILGDDWIAWQGLLTANKHIGTEQNAHVIEELIQAYCQWKCNSRNSRHALLDFYADEVDAGRKSRDDLLRVCWEYFQDFSTKVACFQTLQHYTSKLHAVEQEKLLSLISDSARSRRPKHETDNFDKLNWLTMEINVVKLEYNLVISRNGNANRPDLLVAFIVNCLRLYKVSLCFKLDLPVSDRLPGDDAAILAAMGFVRLYKMRHHNSAYSNSLLRAIVVLEYLLLQSKHNYDALLVLVRLYMFLGAGSLAMERYTRLSIKNMQHATLSWVIFSRISTIHPYASMCQIGTGVRQHLDPYGEIAGAIQWHATAISLSLRQLQNIQKENQWNIFLDTIETQSIIESSFCQSLIYTEMKRISRLRSVPPEGSKLDIVGVLTLTSDTRDRSAFLNYEGGILNFEDCLPQPATSTDINDKWLMTQLFITRLWELVHNNGHSSIRADELEILRDKCDGPGVDEVFTSAEWTVIQVVYPLSELHRIYLEKSGGEHGQKGANRFIREIFKVIANRFEEGRNYLSAYISNERDGCSPLTDNLHTPHWEYFHAVFSNLELYKLTLAVFNFVVAENQKQGKEAFVDPKWMENEVSQYMDACNFMTTACHQSAGRLRSTLTGDIALRGLQEAVLGAAGDTKDAVAHELRAFDNIPAMVKICEDIQASWIDALDGIIRTNIA